MATTVAVIESSPEGWAALARVLNQSCGFHCTGGYTDPEAALRAFACGAPDVVLLDLELVRRKGMEYVGRLKRAAPSLQIVLLVSQEHADLVVQGLLEGASGYVGRQEPWEGVRRVLEQVARGGAVLSGAVAAQILESLRQARTARIAPGSLSWREREILECLAQGHPYKEIAGVLGISIDTVRTYVRRLYAKLKVRSRAHAVMKYQTVVVPGLEGVIPAAGPAGPGGPAAGELSSREASCCV